MLCSMPYLLFPSTLWMHVSHCVWLWMSFSFFFFLFFFFFANNLFQLLLWNIIHYAAWIRNSMNFNIFWQIKYENRCLIAKPKKGVFTLFIFPLIFTMKIKFITKYFNALTVRKLEDWVESKMIIIIKK